MENSPAVPTGAAGENFSIFNHLKASSRQFFLTILRQGDPLTPPSYATEILRKSLFSLRICYWYQGNSFFWVFVLWSQITNLVLVFRL